MTTTHKIVYTPTSDFYLPVNLRFTAGLERRGKGCCYRFLDEFQQFTVVEIDSGLKQKSVKLLDNQGDFHLHQNLDSFIYSKEKTI